MQIRHISEVPDWYLSFWWQGRIRSVNNRARRMGVSGVITVQEWLTIFNQAEGKCVNCGSDEYICIDHIIPLSQGGQNTIENIQPLCRVCNISKYNSAVCNPRWF